MHWSLVFGALVGALFALPAAAITLELPVPGSFHEGSELDVEGFVETSALAGTSLTLDGEELLLDAGEPLPGVVAARFAALVALDPIAVFNPFLLEATRPDQSVSRLRFTVVAGRVVPPRTRRWVFMPMTRPSAASRGPPEKPCGRLPSTSICLIEQLSMISSYPSGR